MVKLTPDDLSSNKTTCKATLMQQSAECGVGGFRASFLRMKDCFVL